MPLTKLSFQPGIIKEWTDYSSEGRWVDCDKVRFRKGRPEKIGGWKKAISTAFTGISRALHTWSDLASAIRTGIGTHLKYFIEEGGVFYDVTPIRRTVTLGTDPITTGSIGSGIITVSDTAHNALLGDYVTLSGATAVDGILAAEINQEHVITEIVSANSYKVDTGGSATAGSTAGGGSSVDANYQINIGNIDYTAGQGWGAGAWSNSDVGWGQANTSATAGGEQMRLWSHDNYGEDLIINPRGYEIFYWDASSGTANRAVKLSSLGGASDTPTVCNITLVTENRQVMAYGCDPIGAGGTGDPMFIRWTDEEDVANWTPSNTNAAGGYRLGVGSEIIAAKKARQEILVWTDAALYSQRYVGTPFIYGFSLVSQNVSIIGPNAAIIADSVMYWMDRGNFYGYTGRVEVLPCTVLEYVFDDFNYNQSWKVVAGRNSEFGEITWFYPSAGSDENDRYVTFNYKENVWTVGTLARTFWEENRLRDKPLATCADSYLWFHEDGENDDTSAMTAYIESGDMDIADGHEFWFITRMIPDIYMTAGMAHLKIVSSNFPQSTEETPVDVTVTPTDTQHHIRLRGRAIKLRIESSDINTNWRLGDVRLDVRKDGRRA